MHLKHTIVRQPQPPQICNACPDATLPHPLYATLHMHGAVLPPKQPATLLRDGDEVEFLVHPQPGPLLTGWGVSICLDDNDNHDMVPNAPSDASDEAVPSDDVDDDSSEEERSTPQPATRPSRSARRKALKRRLIREARCARCGTG